MSMADVDVCSGVVLGVKARNRQQQQPFDAVAAAGGGRGRKEKCGRLGKEEISSSGWFQSVHFRACRSTFPVDVRITTGHSRSERESAASRAVPGTRVLGKLSGVESGWLAFLAELSPLLQVLEPGNCVTRGCSSPDLKSGPCGICITPLVAFPALWCNKKSGTFGDRKRGVRAGQKRVGRILPLQAVD
ncbi:hypothetical protein L207DRAFT_623474 [Hyaloscypha variabilis F]|uniref:Uncharacterized protein n=1 Tax=Hyaloscypha variabilis (strain UAMH 11265 / GT02V1 / F) TaxID=1149755 RepID=A0A2J6RS11_HYAVF|nr:hypothetical protein L207DRAFT_623474 [Hyaloscypha variabilis F]